MKSLDLLPGVCPQFFDLVYLFSIVVDLKICTGQQREENASNALNIYSLLANRLTLYVPILQNDPYRCPPVLSSLSDG